MRLGWRKWAALALGLLLVLLGADTLYAESRTCTLPVLMYHHFAQEGNGGTIVSEARFREQMEALKGGGFTAVTLGEVLDYKLVVTLGAGFALLFCWATIWRRRRDVAGIFLAPKA